MAQYCDPETDQKIKDAVAIEDAAARADATGRSPPSCRARRPASGSMHENAVWGTQAGSRTSSRTRSTPTCSPPTSPSAEADEEI